MTADSLILLSHSLEIELEMNKRKIPFDDRYISKGALKGAATGMAIGARFGVHGIAVGAIIGGVTGYIIDQ
jgi:uncharacterized membrane protein